MTCADPEAKFARAEAHTTCIRIDALIRKGAPNSAGRPARSSHGFAAVAVGDDYEEDAYIPTSVAHACIKGGAVEGGYYRAQVRPNPRTDAPQPWMVTRVWPEKALSEDYWEQRGLPVEVAGGE